MKSVVLAAAASLLIAGAASAQCFKGHSMSMAEADTSKAPITKAEKKPVVVAQIPTDAWLLKFLA